MRAGKRRCVLVIDIKQDKDRITKAKQKQKQKTSKKHYSVLENGPSYMYFAAGRQIRNRTGKYKQHRNKQLGSCATRVRLLPAVQYKRIINPRELINMHTQSMDGAVTRAKWLGCGRSTLIKANKSERCGTPGNATRTNDSLQARTERSSCQLSTIALR